MKKWITEGVTSEVQDFTVMSSQGITVQSIHCDHKTVGLRMMSLLAAWLDSVFKERLVPVSFRQPSDLEEDRTSMLKAGLFLAFFFVAVVTLANGNQVKNTSIFLFIF